MVITSSQEMEELGGRIAKTATKGAVIYLQGELGAGKTTFAKGFLREFGCKDHVKSPTFSLFELYELPNQTICHLDLYRLKKPEEIVYTGALDYFDEKNICLIEWPERGEDFLPKADLVCDFKFVDDPKIRIVNVIPVLAKAGNTGIQK